MLVIRRLVLTAALCLCASAAIAAVKTREVMYRQGGTPLKGYLAWNDNYPRTRPGVLVVHEWWGHNAHARRQARRLAEAGYVAFALDMYGNGRATTHPATAQAFMAEALKQPDVMAARFDAALDLLKKDPHVDPTKIAAIGYCFGGGVVLDRARAGEDLKAVVAFHGALGTEHPAQPGMIKGCVLALVGGADPMTPPNVLAAFKQEMQKAGVNYQVVVYPGAKHSFTNPDAGKAGMPALAYNASADRQSWAEMLKLFRSVLR
jgi:dienelactone hydrolase